MVISDSLPEDLHLFVSVCRFWLWGWLSLSKLTLKNNSSIDFWACIRTRTTRTSKAIHNYPFKSWLRQYFVAITPLGLRKYPPVTMEINPSVHQRVVSLIMTSKLWRSKGRKRQVWWYGRLWSKVKPGVGFAAQTMASCRLFSVKTQLIVITCLSTQKAAEDAPNP